MLGIDGDPDVHLVSLLIVDLILHFQSIYLLVLFHLSQFLIADHKEDVQTVDQCVDEPVLVGLQTLFLMNIQDLGGSDGALLLIHTLDQIRMLRQMLNGLHRDFLR